MQGVFQSEEEAKIELKKKKKNICNYYAHSIFTQRYNMSKHFSPFIFFLSLVLV